MVAFHQNVVGSVVIAVGRFAMIAVQWYGNDAME